MKIRSSNICIISSFFLHIYNILFLAALVGEFHVLGPTNSEVLTSPLSCICEKGWVKHMSSCLSLFLGVQDDVELTDAKGTTLVEHKRLETEV